MSFQTVIRRSPNAYWQSYALGAERANAKLWRERRHAFAALVFEGRQRVWITEEAASVVRRRSLIDDNPASG